MSNSDKPSWSDLTTDQQDEALIEALISGASVFSLVKTHANVLHRDLTRRMASPEFQAKAQPALEEAVAAARLSAAFLSASMLTSGVASRDGLAHKELKLLLDRQKDIQGDATGTPQTDDERTAAAIRFLEAEKWKTKKLSQNIEA